MLEAIDIFLASLVNNFQATLAASLLFLSFVAHANAIIPSKDPHLRRACVLLVFLHFRSQLITVQPPFQIHGTTDRLNRVGTTCS